MVSTQFMLVMIMMKMNHYLLNSVQGLRLPTALYKENTHPPTYLLFSPILIQGRFLTLPYNINTTIAAEWEKNVNIKCQLRKIISSKNTTNPMDGHENLAPHDMRWLPGETNACHEANQGKAPHATVS